MKASVKLLLLLAALCTGLTMVACTPPDDDPKDDDPPPVEQPDDGQTPGDGTEDGEEEGKGDNMKYTYPEEEYSAELPLFGEWSDFFAPGARSDLYDVTAERLANGLYEQTRDEVKTEGVRTYASVDRGYSPAMHVNVDAYIVSPEYAKAYQKAGYDTIGMSGSFNKSTYGKGNPEVMQCKADGDTGGLWDSVVLTRDVVQYNIKNTVRQWVKRTNWVLGYVEPEMFRDGLYCRAYRELWELKYGEEWSDPIGDVRSIFLSQRLNVWTHSNAIKMYVSYINEEAEMPLKYSVAPHSTLAYTTLGNGVTGGYVHMMGTGLVKSVTGQTWSNTIENAIRYQGKTAAHTFVNAYVDYGTYLDAANYYGADFFALCDPMSDTYASKSEDYWRNLCHQQLVASMMYSEINRWELIWTNRSFMNVSPQYRSEQLNIHNALLEISGAEYTATAGTPGVTYLLGDTLSWQNKNTSFAENAYNGFWGVAAPLVYDGIPLRTMAMELITSPEDLEDVSVLIVSYDNQKPLYENTNIAIAEWVKQGGTLLYLGGPDEYLNIDEAWWNESGKGGSPTANLLKHLGVDAKIEAVPLTGNESALVWLGGATDAKVDAFADGLMKVGGDAYTYAYEGMGYDTLLQTKDGRDVGISFDVEKGQVLMVGLSTTDYSDSVAGSKLMRMLTAKALETTEYEYVSADAFVVERGKYTAVYPLRGSYTLTGTYVNVFSPDAALVRNPVVAEGEAALYRRVKDISSLEVPTVMSAGGFVQAIEETETLTTVTVYAAENALIPIRVAAPEGYVATSATVVYDGGEALSMHTVDEKTNSLLVKVISTPTAPATVKICWEKNGTPLKDTAYEGFNISVNQTGMDEKYIVSNTGAANGTSRYCDRDAKIVWAFDVSQYNGLIVSAAVVNNYVIEVSGDGKNFTKVADYSQFTSTRATGTNDGVVSILVDAYADVEETLYIRLRNTDPSQGWGGAVKSFEFQYVVEK